MVLYGNGGQVLSGLNYENPVTQISELTVYIGCSPFRISFAVVDASVIDVCLIIGCPFLSGNNVEIDFDKLCFCNVTSEECISFLLSNPDSYNMHLYSVTVARLFQEDRLSDFQSTSPEMIQLMKALTENKSTRFPATLSKFARFKSQLVIEDGIIYRYFKEEKIPVVPFVICLDVALRTHIHMGHIGQLKLFDLLIQHLWHPRIRAVVADLCRSCTVCQTKKPTGQVIVPPTIKISTSFSFELVAMDLVSMPRSREGFVALLVVIDHHSKWLAIAAMKDKKASTVVNFLEFQIFPGLVRIPVKILTDNGPEFRSFEFTQLLENYRITHLKTTAYKPSSNGAVERVNRTILGLL